MLRKRKDIMNNIRISIKTEYKLARQVLQKDYSLEKDFFFLAEKRVRTLGIRSYFVHQLYKYIREQASLEKIPLKSLPEVFFSKQLPLIAELIITVQYYENQILDGKGGLKQDGQFVEEKVAKNLLGGHYVKDFLYEYMDECIDLECEDKYKLRKTVRKIFQYVDLGQQKQIQQGTFENFKKVKYSNVIVNSKINRFFDRKLITDLWSMIEKEGMSKDKKSFVCNYLNRICLTSAALFRILAEYLMETLAYDGKEKQNILHLATMIGIIGQIVNDNNDFVPPDSKMSTVGKNPEDAFSDLRNDNITLPLAFYFDKKPSQNVKTLKKLLKHDSKLLFELKDAILQSMGIGEKFAKYANLFANSKNKYSELLLDMNSVSQIGCNRFYTELSKCLKRSHIQVHLIEKKKCEPEINQAPKTQGISFSLSLFPQIITTLFKQNWSFN